MSILKQINTIRRAVMRRLTKNVGHSFMMAHQNRINTIQLKRVLICRPNGRLGNLLLITPLVQEIGLDFPDCKIDLFVKGKVAPIIFRNYENIDTIIELPSKPFKQLFKYIITWFKIRKKRYDLVVNIDQNSSSGRLSTRFARSEFKIFGDLESGSEHYYDRQHIAKNPVYNYRHFLNIMSNSDILKPMPVLDLKLNESEISNGKILLQQLVKNNKKTIGIFTYATGEKCYAADWWESFYAKLKLQYDDYNIIEVLPAHNASQIAFQAPSFYSNDIREMGSLIANVNLFIAADSGIMHLASASKIPVVGLFSVTDVLKYRPYNDYSLAINTNNLSIETCVEIVEKTLTKTIDTTVRPFENAKTETQKSATVKKWKFVNPYGNVWQSRPFTA